MSRKSRGTLLALGAATAAVAAFGLGRVTARAPRAPDDLAGSIRAALGEGDALERLARTTSLLEGLDPERLPGVVAVYERMIPFLDSAELVPLFSAWARFDPAGAIEHALAWPMWDMQEERRSGVRAALESWAQADPSSARRASEELAAAHPRLRELVWSSLAAGWARSDRGPEGLGAFLAGVRPTRYRDEAAAVALRELVRAGGAEAALAWADTILRSDEVQDPGFQRAVFDAAVGNAAAWDPERTGAWLTGHSEAAYAAGGSYILAEQWGRRDGAAAMEWLEGTPAGERRDQVVRAAFIEWSRADRGGAKSWLESVSPTAFHDPALEVLADQLTAEDPLQALGWCERIADPARRQSCLESSARRWYAQDALEAETWLQQSPLDEEARSNVRRTPRQQDPGPRRPRGARPPR